MKELKSLNKYFYKYRKTFILGIIITIASQIFTVWAPEFIGNSVSVLNQYLKDEVTKEFAKDELIKYFGLIIGTTLISGFLTFWMRQTIIVMSRHVEFDMKNEIFQQYQKLSLDFFKNQRTGDLMSRISEDVSKVRQYVGPAVMYSINTAIRMTVVIIQMMLISPKLSMYALIPVPVLAIVMMKLTSEINKRSFAYQQNLSKLSSFSQEIFSGIRVIKAYAQENTKSDEYNGVTVESKNIFMRLATTNALIGPLMIALIGLSNIFVIYIGATMYISGEIKDIGVIAQFIMYINLLTWPIASLGWVASMIQEADSSQKRINEFMKEEPTIKEIQNPIIGDIKGSIRFENVSFVYKDTGIQALDNISFELKKGKTLAILGHTGSGKSTLLHLISRLYDPQKGNIYIDEEPIKEYQIKNLRNAIATVPQEAFLFSDSIKNNIKYGKPEATNEEIIRYAKISDVDRNIKKFKNAYETVLGERGLTLSGGQKQRVSIARALIKQSPILILDDSLSAVDTETEERILKNLNEVTENQTTLIVTHRISSAKNADFIIILENGKIIESGDHQTLMLKNGYYSELYAKQLTEKDVK